MLNVKNIVVPLALYNLRDIDRARLSFQDVGLTEPVQNFCSALQRARTNFRSYKSTALCP